MRERDELIKWQIHTFNDFVGILEQGKTKAEDDILKLRDELGQLRYFEDLRSRKLYQAVDKTEEYMEDFRRENLRHSKRYNNTYSNCVSCMPYESCECNFVENPWLDPKAQVKATESIFKNVNEIEEDNYWVKKGKTGMLMRNGSAVLGDRKLDNDIWKSNSWFDDRNSRVGEWGVTKEHEKRFENRQMDKSNKIMNELDTLVQNLKKIGNDITFN